LRLLKCFWIAVGARRHSFTAATRTAHPLRSLGRKTEPRTVLAHGCFDVLHLGHKRHLEEARSLGDRLVVSITPDHLVNKGPGRPVFNAEERREMLLALGCVDDVIIAPGPTARSAIELIKPDVYVKGVDYLDSDHPDHVDDIRAAEALGGTVHITRTAKWSSSRIINSERLSPEAVAYLDAVRDRGWLDRIHAAFKKADQLKILFVGETIIDEYKPVTALAKPSKEFILATVEAGEPERFLGGVVAASLQAEWPNIKVITNDGPPIKKTRYVEPDFGRKIFEVYNRTQIDDSPQRRQAFMDKLASAQADVVVVFDFGHGLIDDDARKDLRAMGGFLAVNAQTNAGNYGFNPVSRYAGADLACVDLPEARLSASRQYGQPGELAGTLGFKQVIITAGRHGSYCPGHVPAFGTRAVDTMGAGDAFLSVAGPLIAAGLDIEAATLVGNVAGALKTEIVGHRRHVRRDELLQAVECLLK
jgi:rfaE bifunctional protein nucleotidyltransferase chain/domain